MSKEDGSDKPTDTDADNPQFPTFFKYCSDDDGVVKGIFEEHKIRFTQPAALNDPLEFQPTVHFGQGANKYVKYVFDGVVFPSEELWLRIQLVERQLNGFGVLSLTKIPDCFDMWSRYANGHKGFLLELKANFNEQECMRGKDGRVYEVREVTYADQYLIEINDLVNERGNIPFDAFNVRVFFTKTSRWRHEMEYRMVRPLRDHPAWQSKSDRAHRDRGSCYLFDFSLDCVQSVTFGACMAVENKRRITEACRGIRIDLLQAILTRDQKDKHGRPGRVKLVPAGAFPNLLEMSDADLISDAENITERLAQPISISRLSALPYYDGHEEWIAQYYKNRKAKCSQ